MHRIFTINGTSLFKRIWNEQKISQRTILTCVAVPFLLTSLVVAVKLWLFPGNIAAPYLFFFAVIMISACYGGGRSAIFASAITFIASVSLLFLSDTISRHAIEKHIIQALVFLIESLFLSGLISGFQHLHAENAIGATALEESNLIMKIKKKEHEDFVHMAAHELKTPVTVLKAYNQLFQAKLLKDQRQDELILAGKMETQLDKLINLISDLLDAARISSGSMSCVMTAFRINDCIKDSIEAINAANPNCKIECELENSDPIIWGDQDRIDQVLANLIGNAIKYSVHEKYVKIASALNNGNLVIKVFDKGMGIPLDRQKYVFERFYRASDPPMGTLPGLGLGLFISAEIIKKHAGTIGLESEVGKGSVFWFSLPVKRSAVIT